MFEKLEQCPACGNTTFRNHIICKDYTVSQEEFAIVQCDKCNLQFTNPRPDKLNLGKYYQSEDYISHADKTFGLTDIIYKLVRRFTLQQKLKLVSNLNTSKTMLDYGCGTGYFLKEGQKAKWTIAGIEPNEKARMIANQQLNGIVEESLDLIPTDNKFGIISLWHVLEHVFDLNTTIEQLVTHLDKNGFMVVAVPNPLSYDATYYKKYWAAYDLPRHLYHFTPDTLKVVAKKHGLKIVDVIPMKFDAYYVSLLSEKYKTGSNKYLKSIVTGYKSNSYAKKHDNNYSSLIYILSKK
ncbi:MAG TPA: class I SAM-dependent methyltransferase [Fulvivirga sp.]|nr:class I SAM-dependent methyltransferase [Fulvivirga sp.]